VGGEGKRDQRVEIGGGDRGTGGEQKEVGAKGSRSGRGEKDGWRGGEVGVWGTEREGGEERGCEGGKGGGRC